LEVIMPRAHLRHTVTKAEIDVEVPPTGLSQAYLRSGWVEFVPEPESEPKQPAEPVNPSPATPPGEKTKE
jgi:hypothetical protein